MKRVVMAVLAVLGAVLGNGAPAVVGSVALVRVASAGHLHEPAAAPRAPAVIVFGGQLAPDRVTPWTVLRHRLDTTVQLVAAGKADAVLVSGDGNGGSGDETTAMTRYLVEHGVPAAAITADPSGVDSYHTCLRARDVYRIKRALLVSQGFHVPRAVALCRWLGLDADGVYAGCAGCTPWAMVWNTGRDWLACPKAVFEAAVGPVG